MSPSSCYGNLGCYCSYLGRLKVAPFFPGDIRNGSYCISISSIIAQWTSSRQHLESLTGGLRNTLNISVQQDLVWRLINLLSPFRLQVNTWTGMLPLFLCASDGTSPNRTNSSLRPTSTASTRTCFKSTLNSISSLSFLPFSMSWERNKLGCLVSAVNQKVTCS